MPLRKAGPIITAIFILSCSQRVLLLKSVTELTQRSSVLTSDVTYACQLETDSVTHKYYLNVSTTTAAQLTTNDLELLSQSETGMWYVYTNEKIELPPLIYHYFWLTSNTSDMTGNCSWFIGVEYESLFGCELKGGKHNTRSKCRGETHTSAPGDSTITDSTTETRPSTSVTTSALAASSASVISSMASSPASTDVATDPTPQSTSASTTAAPTSTLKDTADDVDDINAKSNASCLCPCACIPKSQKEFDDMLKSIVDDLKIPPDTLGQSKRKRLSASDERLLSRGIGWCGVLVLTAVFGVILAGDAKLLTRDARRMVCDLKRRVLP